MNERYTPIIIFGGLLAALIVATVFRQLTERSQPQLISIDPSPTEPHDSFSGFTLTFDKALSQAFFDSCRSSIAPKADLLVRRSAATLSVLPETYFLAGTEYLFTLTCDNRTITEFTFSTVPEDELSDIEQNQLQTRRDYAVAKDTEEFYTENPWYASLPISTEEYLVIYDHEAEDFVVVSRGPNLNQTEYAPLIREQLSEIGAPELPLVWK